LTADHTADKDVCIKIPSSRESVNGVTVLQPGAGRCGKNNTGFVQPGTYTLDEGRPPKDTVFKQWECYNITFGVQSAPVIVESITLAGNSSVTCVAVFDLLPLPKLALIADLPPGYSGPPVNLTATNGNESCTEAPAAQLGVNGTTITNPGPGLCRGNGTMPPGTYQLVEPASPPGLEFDSYTCYDVDGTNFTLRGRDVETVILQRDDFVTCVAKFVPLPKLALTSRFPAEYSGPSELTRCGRQGVLLRTCFAVLSCAALCCHVLCCTVLCCSARADSCCALL
jgi:hypothetical protein